jgi:hypothetical protein
MRTSGKRRDINQESLEDVLGTFARIVSECPEFKDETGCCDRDRGISVGQLNSERSTAVTVHPRADASSRRNVKRNGTVRFARGSPATTSSVLRSSS